MGTTPNYALRYPASSAPVEVWTDIQNLASDTDTALDGIADALAALKTWTTFVPTFLNNQGGGTPAAVAKTVIRAGYWRLGVGAGSIIISQAEVTATAAATGGMGIGLPVTAAERWFLCGVAGIYGGTPPTQAGHAYMGSALDKLHIINFTGGFQDVSIGQTVRYLAIYKSAS
jgi:hypothetical protein